MDYNKIFNWCVQLLENWAKALGMTYEEINIWIFCIIEPIVFFFMLFYILYLRRRLKGSKRLVNNTVEAGSVMQSH